MRVIEILEQYKVCVVDFEVELNGEMRHAPTLCAVSDDQVIPLNTPDGRPILMNPDNAVPKNTA